MLKDIPKIHIAMELFDNLALTKFTVRIQDIEERYSNKEKYFVYVINISRNDGLEWTIQKRYSQIHEFRDHLKHHSDVNVSYLLLFFAYLA